MSNNTPTIARGQQYVVFFKGGAFDGQIERRVAGASGWDDVITVLASVDGTETQLVYTASTAREIGDQVQVTYLWDALSGDDIESLDERNEH